MRQLDKLCTLMRRTIMHIWRGEAMIGLMEGVLFLVCLGGVAGMWLYFFIKEAEEHTGWVRVAAFACRMAVVMVLAAAIMALAAFGSSWRQEAWSQIQIRTRGVEALGEVLQTTSYQVMSGRRFHRQWTESYSTTLRLSPECGVETASINAKFRLYGDSDRSNLRSWNRHRRAKSRNKMEPVPHPRAIRASLLLRSVAFRRHAALWLAADL